MQLSCRLKEKNKSIKLLEHIIENINGAKIFAEFFHRGEDGAIFILSVECLTPMPIYKQEFSFSIKGAIISIDLLKSLFEGCGAFLYMKYQAAKNASKILIFALKGGGFLLSKGKNKEIKSDLFRLAKILRIVNNENEFLFLERALRYQIISKITSSY